MIKKFRQKLYALFSAVILICGAISGVFCITTSTNKANAESVALGAYYYNQLNGIEKKFYNIFNTHKLYQTERMRCFVIQAFHQRLRKHRFTLRQKCLRKICGHIRHNLKRISILR